MTLAGGRFEPFGGEHLLLVGMFLAGAVGIVLLGRRQRGTPVARRFSRAYALVIPCLTVPSQIYQLTPADFSLGSSLPLQLCDLAWMTAVWALWTHGRVPVALTYFWGLTLTVQAIITPSLQEAFPDPRYFAFWAMHFLIVWSALYLTLGLGLGPRWREYGATVAVTVGWAVLVFGVNRLLGVNYGYLNHKPGSASLLDLLGPWPVYVFAALGILLAGWALMTWPWVLVDRRRDRRTPAAG
jgi:hypothetical integral membrane protein (TIGR02206 family)